MGPEPDSGPATVRGTRAPSPVELGMNPVTSIDSSVRPVKLSCQTIWKLFGRFEGRSFGSRDQLEEAVAAAGRLAVLRDVSLSIGDGEIFVVMGLSGSGKSTLLRCLARLIEPSYGTVDLDGLRLTSLPTKQLREIRRHKMAMVFQSFALLPHLTVRENIELPLRVRGTPPVERARQVEEAVALVGLTERASFRPRELSGGQQQRVGLARALAGDPSLLFLDEPFSALDPLIRRELQDELLRLQSRLHKTLVFVTHDFNEAVRLGDRIAIMKDGSVVQIGTPEEIVLDPANDYVRAFVADVDRARVISCGRVAGPPRAQSYGTVVSGRERIASVVGRASEIDGPIGVVDAAGAVVGELDPSAILRVLASGRAEGPRL